MRSSRRHTCKFLIFVSFGLLVLGTSLGQQQLAGRTASVHVAVVNERGQYITGLEKETFSLLEDNVSREIVSMDSSNLPASVAVLMDTSGSMTRDRMTVLADWATQFILKANPSNEYLFIAFDSKPNVLCDWNCNGKEVLAALDSVAKTNPRRETALFDAGNLALEKIKTRSHPKRLIVFLSDGENNRSKLNARQFARALRESDVMVYAIGFSNSAETGAEGQKTLRELASVTGGQTWFPNTVKALQSTAGSLATELKYQYTLTFRLPHPPDQKFHSIKVKVNLLLPPKAKKARVVTRAKPDFYDQ